jgi:hypothetical protein
VYKCCWGLCWKVTKVLYWLNKPFLSNSNLSRYLLNDPRNWALHHEGVWGNECIYPHFPDLDTSWRWVVSFTLLPLYPRERAHGTHCIGGWVDVRAGLDDVENRKFLTLPGLELRPLGRPSSRYTDYAIPTPIIFQGQSANSGSGMVWGLFNSTVRPYRMEWKDDSLIWRDLEGSGNSLVKELSWH